MVKIKYFLWGFYLMVSGIVMFMPSSGLRKIWLKICLNKIGANSFVFRNVKILFPLNISIGNNSVINTSVLLDGRVNKILIGDNVDIAQETNIWTLEHDVNDNGHITKGGDVIIEDYVWIASRVTILPGVKIGKGAVVACGSIVTKSVPSMAIVGGVPARVIGTRENSLDYKIHLQRPNFT